MAERSRRRFSLVAALAAGGLLVLSATSVLAATRAVSIVDLDFEPSSVRISVGDTVVWTNNGEAPHNVHFRNGPASEILDNGERYSRRFNDAGTYEYICDVHPSMNGRVVVAAAGGGATPAPTATARPTGTASPGATQPPTDTAGTSGPTAGGGLGAAALLAIVGLLGLTGTVLARRRGLAR